MLHLDHSLSQKTFTWNTPEDAHFLDQQHQEQQQQQLGSAIARGGSGSTSASAAIQNQIDGAQEILVKSPGLLPDSPNQDHSSPLSPVPDLPSTTAAAGVLYQPTLQHLNPHMALAEEKEAPLEVPQREEEEEDETQGAVSPIQQQTNPSLSKPGGVGGSGEDPPSRQSTPLSELSPASDDDIPDSMAPSTPTMPMAHVNGAGHDRGVGEDTQSLSAGAAAGNRNSATGDVSSLDHHSHSHPSSSSAVSTSNGDNFFPPGLSSNLNPLSSPTRPSSSSFSQSQSQSPDSFLPLTGNAPSTISMTAASASTTSSQDPRAVAILELNVELFRYVVYIMMFPTDRSYTLKIFLRICMFLQNKGIQTSDPRFVQSVPLLVMEDNNNNNFPDSPLGSNQTSPTLQQPPSSTQTQILKPKINPTTVPPTPNPQTSTPSRQVTQVLDLVLHC